MQQLFSKETFMHTAVGPGSGEEGMGGPRWWKTEPQHQQSPVWQHTAFLQKKSLCRVSPGCELSAPACRHTDGRTTEFQPRNASSAIYRNLFNINTLFLCSLVALQLLWSPTVLQAATENLQATVLTHSASAFCQNLCSSIARAHPWDNHPFH